jgi:hypothetical protein
MKKPEPNSGLIDKPVGKFLGARAAPERLRSIARFLEKVAAAIESRTVDSSTDHDRRCAT